MPACRWVGSWTGWRICPSFSCLIKPSKKGSVLPIVSKHGNAVASPCREEW